MNDDLVNCPKRLCRAAPERPTLPGVALGTANAAGHSNQGLATPGTPRNGQEGRLASSGCTLPRCHTLVCHLSLPSMTDMTDALVHSLEL